MFTLETREDRDPDEVSSRLSLTATRVIRVGDRLGVSKRASPRAAWTLETTLWSPDLNRQLAETLSTLAPRSESIAALTANEYDGILSLVGSFTAQVPIIKLAQEQLVLVRSLGAEMDIDIEAS